MTPMPEPQHARPRAEDWTWSQALLATLLTAGTLATGGPAGYSVFQTSRDLARAWLHHQAWILPTALEAVFIVLFGWGILLAWRKVADVPIRIAFQWLIAGFSVAVQVYAGRHSAGDVMVRLAIVSSFLGSAFTMKAALMRLRGGKVRGDRVSLGEWLASPARAAGLWRWKNAWAEPSADRARARYLVLLYVIALAQAALAQADERAGRTRRTRFGWRRRLPVTLRYELSTGLLPAAITAGGDSWQEAAQDHVRTQLDLLASPAEPATEDATPVATEGRQEDATEHASRDATEADSSTPAATPRPRQRPRQPTAAERAKRDARVRRILAANPSLTLAQVAAKAEVSERTVSRIKNAPPERPSLRLANADAAP